ncbi:Hypothetical predicted protein [Marmota monax]|uniref:Uncharacterized protein n=1 Tax=Marmota monax TaxID=9995 RepID=A0A5E4BXJ3_MARMO|nr:hypothetical protein GHT09_010713 [Marmota monax]VTJ74347.1 Hypothetical predicted protein [Marmota monax]
MFRGAQKDELQSEGRLKICRRAPLRVQQITGKQMGKYLRLPEPFGRTRRTYAQHSHSQENTCSHYPDRLKSLTTLHALMRLLHSVLPQLSGHRTTLKERSKRIR